MGKNKRTKATEFGKCARANIKARDGGCIFCKMNYKMPPEGTYGLGMFQIMHYIPRSQGGRGIQENGAVGCIYHHNLLDNGKNTRKEMLQLFKNYLKEKYPFWDEKHLVYRKGMLETKTEDIDEINKNNEPVNAPDGVDSSGRY